MTKRKKPEDLLTRGVKTKFTVGEIEKVYRLALFGADNERIAEFLKINTATFQRWLLKYPDLRASLDRGRHEASTKVAKALFRRALGYKIEEITTRVSKYGGKDQVSKTRISKRIPADVNAAMFWLKTRHPEIWGEKKEPTEDKDITVNVAVSVDGVDASQRYKKLMG